jgi:predicted LPLAT superfamily acyltransferase
MSHAQPPSAGGWTAQRERSNLLALSLMRWIAMGAGRRISRWILHPIALYFFVVHGTARRASRTYLNQVLQRPARWTEVYRHVHHFAACVLDRVYFLQDRFEEFEVTAHGGETMLAAVGRGDGLFLLGAHLGSFEALRAGGQTKGARIAMLMFEENARFVNAALAAVAPKAQLHTIALGRPSAMLALRRWLDEGGVAGLLADRTLPGQSERSGVQHLNFLGRPACFSDGPFRLAAMLRRQVVFMAGLYQGGKRYDLHFIEVADFRSVGAAGSPPVNQLVQEALARYVALLESLCRASPYNWFNFYDFWSDAAPSSTAIAHETH